MRAVRSKSVWMVRGAIALLVAAACMRALPAAAADTYPSRPVRLVVGFGAGGPTDIPARFIADKLGAALKQSVVVENKPAAGGIVATRDVLAQPPDGYTLLLCTHFDADQRRGLSQRRLQALGHRAGLADRQILLRTGAGQCGSRDGFQIVRRLRQGASRRSDLCHRRRRLRAGDHGAPARQADRHHHDAHSVPRRTWGGSGVDRRACRSLRLADAGGRPQYYKAKQLKILATTSPERLATLPEVPTLREDGIDFVRFGWLGVCARAGTPAPIIETLNKNIVPSLHRRTTAR